MGVEAAIPGLPEIPAGVYQHYKGGFYWVPGIVSIDEESGRYRVLYWSLTKRVWWAREYYDFMSWVERDKPRFVRVGGRLLWWRIRVYGVTGL